MGKRGAKPWEPSEREIATIELYAGLGATQEQIAEHLGKSSDSIYRHANDHFKRGKLKTVMQMAGKMVGLANAGDFHALKFYLATQGGWTEKKAVEHSGSMQMNISGEQVAALTEDELELLDALLGKLASSGGTEG